TDIWFKYIPYHNRWRTPCSRRGRTTKINVQIGDFLYSNLLIDTIQYNRINPFLVHDKVFTGLPFGFHQDDLIPFSLAIRRIGLIHDLRYLKRTWIEFTPPGIDFSRHNF